METLQRTANRGSLSTGYDVSNSLKFEDGTKVPSVANTFVTFPSDIKHTGTTCTDQKFRSVINFNYINVKENDNT